MEKITKTDMFNKTIEALLLAFAASLGDDNSNLLKFLTTFVIIWIIVIIFTYFRKKK